MAYSSSLRTCAAAAAILLASCASPGVGPHGLGSVKTAEAASARAATEREDWQAAACSWFAVFEAGGSESAVACVETARALCELGDARSAQGVLQQGLARHPGDPNLLEMQGRALRELSFRRAAEQSYLQALEADPDRGSALLELARVRSELGMENAAREPLVRRIALGMGDAETYELLARVDGALGETRAAFESCERAIQLGGNTSERARLAAELLGRDNGLSAQPARVEQTAAWLTAAIARDPQDTRALHQLGALRERAGNDDAAIEHYRRAIETDPMFVPALTALAELHARRGEKLLAEAMANRALALEKEPARRETLARLIQPPAIAAPSDSQP